MTAPLIGAAAALAIALLIVLPNLTAARSMARTTPRRVPAGGPLYPRVAELARREAQAAARP